MALYHFTVKTDKRPGRNGAKIAAISHVEYINREGAFAKIDEKDATSMNNMISSMQTKDALNGQRVILYKSSYGDITNTEDGLLLDNEPSYDTIAIALMVAQKTMKGPLEIKGSDNFKQKCVMAAVTADLPISFLDARLQSQLTQKRKDIQNERERYEANGGRIIRKSSGRVQQSDPITARKSILSAPTTGTVPSLYKLSQRHLVVDGSSKFDVLVQADAYDQLVNTGTSSAAIVRRDFSRGRRRRAELTAAKILKNIEMNADTVTSAAAHVEYINREKAFKKKGGCIYTAHRLPRWANDSPNKFFKAADRYSPKDARRYQEIEFSLQNELTLEQNLEIVRAFIDKNLSNHYYAFAIHDKIGVMSDGSHNLHVHLMFSPRIIDDIEKKRERLVSKYFKYPLRKNAKDQSEKNRRNSGAPMDRRFSTPEFIKELRISYQDITNEILKKYGRSARVDHRSLKAQKLEAEANGDEFLAKLLDRIPENHISKHGMLDEKSSEVSSIKKYRELKKRYQDLLFEHISLEREKEEVFQTEKDKELQDKIKRILSSNEFIESDNNENSYIGELRKEFLNALKKYDSLKEHYETKEEILERTRIEYMTPTEREDYQKYKHTLEEMNHWITFSDNLQHPETDDEKELKAYDELLVALAEKIQKLEEARQSQKMEVDKIELRLEQTDIQKQIQLIVARTMRENRHDWETLKHAEQNLEVSTKTLEQALFYNERTEIGLKEYHTKELYQIMRRRYYGYKKAAERLKAQLILTKKKVISINRATAMAKDIYTNGALKKLRSSLEKLKKQEVYLGNDKNDLQSKIKKDGLLPEYITIKEELSEKEKILTEEYYQLKKQQKIVEERISNTEAQEKIHTIALGIVRKNSGYAKRYESLKDELKSVNEKMFEAQKEMNLLKEAVSRAQGDKLSYRVDKKALKAYGTPPPAIRTSNGNVDEPSAIVRALLKADGCPNFVACSRRDNDDSLKNWVLMSEIEKMEEEEKRLYSI